MAEPTDDEPREPTDAGLERMLRAYQARHADRADAELDRDRLRTAVTYAVAEHPDRELLLELAAQGASLYLQPVADEHGRVRVAVQCGFPDGHPLAERFGGLTMHIGVLPWAGLVRPPGD